MLIYMQIYSFTCIYIQFIKWMRTPFFVMRVLSLYLIYRQMDGDDPVICLFCKNRSEDRIWICFEQVLVHSTTPFSEQQRESYPSLWTWLNLEIVWPCLENWKTQHWYLICYTGPMTWYLHRPCSIPLVSEVDVFNHSKNCLTFVLTRSMNPDKCGCYQRAKQTKV